MIDPEESALDDDNEATSNAPSSDASTDNSSAEPTSDATDSGTPDPPDEEGLPEWEPLTPELVEDEAIRGDVMLRWAVILLALLMGWTVIQETAVLTHIKSGQVLAANGFLPSGHDALSSTAGESRWIHLSWLFDLSLAGIFSVAGEAGLSVLKAVAAALVFLLLSRVSVPEIPTWWGSVCGALALVAVFPSLTATPAIVTLLGVAILLVLLNRPTRGETSPTRWPYLLLILIWAQLDDRAWIGVAMLLAYAVGQQLDRNRRSDDPESGPSTSLIPVALACLFAMLIHPFLWETWLSPLKLYQIDYPTQQIYAISGEPDGFRHFPMWDADFWSISYFNGAALLLWGVTLVVFVLNWPRVKWAHLALFAAATLLAVAGGGELAVASLVFAALATLNAQQWYAASFRQSYSVETSELAFSRGGRALTVIAFFALAFVMVAGHLTGAAGRRIGSGFDAQLAQTIGSYREVLAESVDDRPFNFRPSQGDILNWVDQHPFVDSRLRLFGAGSPSIVDEHLQTRVALRIPRDGTPQQREVWQTIFDKYDINQTLPRLSGDSPDYVTFHDLLRSPDWEMTGLDSDTAVFVRTDRENADIASFVAEHRASNLVESQLRSRNESSGVNPSRTDWPQPSSVYSRYVYQPTPSASQALQRARHFLSLSDANQSMDQTLAAAYAAIRDVHRGLVDDPDNHAAYLVLGQAYATLWAIERGIMQAQGLQYPTALRFSQTIAAYHHALACEPADASSHLRLFGIYAEQQRNDLALHHILEFEKLTGRLTLLPETHPDFPEQQMRTSEFVQSLATEVADVEEQRDEDLAAGMDPGSLAQSMAAAGYTLSALEIIETDLTMLSGKPELAFLYARLLLEAGRTREAYDQFQGLGAVAGQGQIRDWATYAAISEVVAEELNAALATLKTDEDTLESSSALVMMQPTPLQVPGPTDGSEPINAIVPVARQLQMAGIYFDQLLPRLEAITLNRALIELELGKNADAATLLNGLLERNPTSALRPIAETYLTLLTKDADIPPLPDADERVLQVPDVFDEEEADAGNSDAESTDDTVEDTVAPSEKDADTDAATDTSKEAVPGADGDSTDDDPAEDNSEASSS